MNINKKEYIDELNRNYNELGEDLLMLEAILSIPEGEGRFPGEYVASSLERIQDYARQHTREIDLLANCLIHASGLRRAIGPMEDCR